MRYNIDKTMLRGPFKVLFEEDTPYLLPDENGEFATKEEAVLEGIKLLEKNLGKSIKNQIVFALKEIYEYEQKIGR